MDLGIKVVRKLSVCQAVDANDTQQIVPSCRQFQSNWQERILSLEKDAPVSRVARRSRTFFATHQYTLESDVGCFAVSALTVRLYDWY
jgi:hypothetical protein